MSTITSYACAKVRFVTLSFAVVGDNKGLLMTGNYSFPHFVSFVVAVV